MWQSTHPNPCWSPLSSACHCIDLVRRARCQRSRSQGQISAGSGPSRAGGVAHELKAHTRPERCYLLEMSHKPGTIRAEGAVATRHNGARARSSYHQIVQCFQDQSKTFSVLGKKEFTSHRNASVARSHTEADWQLTTTVQCKQRVRTSIWMWFMCVGACVRV